MNQKANFSRNKDNNKPSYSKRDNNNNKTNKQDNEKKPYKKSYTDDTEKRSANNKTSPYKSSNKPNDKNTRTYKRQKPIDSHKDKRDNKGGKDFGENKPYTKKYSDDNKNEKPNDKTRTYKSSSDRTKDNNTKSYKRQKPIDGYKDKRDNKGDKDFGENKPYTKKYSDDNKNEKPNDKTRTYKSSSDRTKDNNTKSYKRQKPIDGNKDKRDNTNRTKKTSSKSDQPGERLNKYIANAGICSRREADDLIKAGTIKVNGKTIVEMGYRVMPNDKIHYNNELICQEEKIYILMNKPKDYITTSKDPQKRRTVLSLLGNNVRIRVYPVGRLDRLTTGVLLLTNDGEMAKKLVHPSSNKKKIYHVFLDKNVKNEHLQQILAGINLEDGYIKADAIQYPDPNDKKQVGVELHSGRNRIIRRIFEHLGYDVGKLDRVYFAGLTKKGLQRGEWRYLTEKEIQMLRMGAFE